MLDLLRQLGFVLLFGTLFSGLGIIVQNWLVAKGIVRPDKISVISISFALVIINVFWFNDLSWWSFSLICILAITLGANRGDLYTTMRLGPWWWKNDNGD